MLHKVVVTIGPYRITVQSATPAEVTVTQDSERPEKRRASAAAPLAANNVVRLTTSSDSARVTRLLSALQENGAKGTLSADLSEKLGVPPGGNGLSGYSIALQSIARELGIERKRITWKKKTAEGWRWYPGRDIARVREHLKAIAGI
jgi:hypothetical protein